MCSRDCAHTKAATVERIMIMLITFNVHYLYFQGKNNHLLTDLKAYMQGVFIGYRVYAS